MSGYRRHGHNELDEPEFTQPIMYKYRIPLHITLYLFFVNRQIRGAQQTAPQKYHIQLVSEGVSTEEAFTEIKANQTAHLDSAFKSLNNVKKTVDLVASEDYKGNRAFTGKWRSMTFSVFGKEEPTGYDVSALRRFAEVSVQTPSSFEVHPRLKKHHIQSRLSQIEKNSVDWPTAEAAAFASLLTEGYNIRFTGQDVERGTFSQRHLSLTDVNTEKKWSPLGQPSEGYSPKGKFELHNSPLSETGVLSYEYGYSIEDPNNLVLWEAQFGDFFNTAQVTDRKLLITV